MSKNKASARVLIAEDVLRQLAAQRMYASHGNYVSWNKYDEWQWPEFESDKPLAPQIKEAPPCYACAKGACFIAAVDRFKTLQGRDVIEVNDFDERDFDLEGIHRYLFTLFDARNIHAIEGAFEGWGIEAQMDNQADEESLKDGNVPIREEVYNYSGLPMDKDSADVRLGMIMRNIIENDGTFMPQKFIDEMKKSGYDHDVLKVWEPKKKDKNEQK